MLDSNIVKTISKAQVQADELAWRLDGLVIEIEFPGALMISNGHIGSADVKKYSINYS